MLNFVIRPESFDWHWTNYSIIQTDDLAGGGGHGVSGLLLPHLLPAQAESDLRWPVLGLPPTLHSADSSGRWQTCCPKNVLGDGESYLFLKSFALSSPILLIILRAYFIKLAERKILRLVYPKKPSFPIRPVWRPVCTWQFPSLWRDTSQLSSHFIS